MCIIGAMSGASEGVGRAGTGVAPAVVVASVPAERFLSADGVLGLARTGPHRLDFGPPEA
jgi:hypothetical protein